LAGCWQSRSGFPTSYCSVGTHPHHADEEDGIAADELIEAERIIPGWWRWARRGWIIFTSTAHAKRKSAAFGAHIAAARATGLPLVILPATPTTLRPYPRR